MTFDQDRERLNLAWTRFFVLAIYRPLKPLIVWLSRLLTRKAPHDD